MATELPETDIGAIQELLDTVFAAESSDDTVREALDSLKSMIEPSATEEEEIENEAEDTGSKDRIASMKHHILTAKPNFLEYLVKLPEDKETEVDFYLATSKGEIMVEILREFPPAKLASFPIVEPLLRSSFRDSSTETLALRAQNEVVRNAVAALLCPDSAAEEANCVIRKTLSEQIQSFSDILSPTLLASEMTADLAKRQRSLVSGLLGIVNAPLKADAAPAFIQAGGLGALLAVIFRGAFDAPDSDTSAYDTSIEDACDALYKLLERCACKELTQAFIEQQIAGLLLEKLTHICGLEGMYSAPYVPFWLVVLSKSNDVLGKQVANEARKMISSNPDNLGPGAAIVLWKILQAGEEHEIKDIERISESNKYVPFFLSPCKRGALDGVLGAVEEALAARIGKPGDQLRKGISTPEQVERFVVLLEYASRQMAPDITSTMQVLRELVLPTDPEASGGFYDPDEDIKRINRKFCLAFGAAMNKYYEAARALAPSDWDGKAEIKEPSEEGLANMKNVKMLDPIVQEQYSTAALLSGGLMEYLQYLLFNPSPLSRRAGIELLTALTHDSSLARDFEYVPNLIEAFQEGVVFLLGDPRALIRALAMQWLIKIMSYRHPREQSMNRYKPAIDFVTKSIGDEKLVEMLKGTRNEATVAAGMIEALAQHSRGSNIRNRFRENQEMVEGLWNGVFWDDEKASTAPEDKDGDISDDVFIYGNIQTSCGDALSQILDPFSDHASIVQRIAPRIAELKEKEAYEFGESLVDIPAVASFAVMAPETGVLTKIGKMISNEEDLPHAMTALRHLAQGMTLPKVSLGQSDDIYPALVKTLEEGKETQKQTVLDDLEFLLSASTVSKIKFLESGGIKPLLEVIGSEDDDTSRKAASSLAVLVNNFPEGAQAAIEAGAITILETKDDSSDMFQRVSNALELLKEFKDAPAIDRIGFTPESYAVFGKKLGEPGAMDKLVQNLKGSADEKQLAIAGGLLQVFAEMLRSGSDPLPVLEALHAIYVADGVILGGLNPAAMAGQACGLPDVLEPLIKSEIDEIKEYATAIRVAVLMEQNDELEAERGEEQDEGENEEEAEEDPEQVD